MLQSHQFSTDAHETIACEGLLSKRSVWSRDLVCWYCTLIGSKLYLSSCKEASHNPHAEIDLSYCKSVEISTLIDNSFQIVTTSNTFFLLADSRKERNQWIKAIKSLITKSSQHHSAELNFHVRLFKLSQYILAPILSHWLSLHDIGKLETAVCFTKDKNNYIAVVLKKFNCLTHVFGNNYWLPCHIKLLSWLALRIDLNNLEIKNLRIELNFNALFEIIELANHFEHDILNLFSQLNAIKISNLHVDSKSYLIELLVAIGENLLEFHLTDTTSFDLSDILTSIAVYCPNIEVLNISGSVYVSQQCVINTCMYCPNLSELNVKNCLYMSAPLIECITIYCDNLTSLDIRGCISIKKFEIMVLAYYHRKPCKVLKMSVPLSDTALTMLIDHAGSDFQTLKVSGSRTKEDNKDTLPMISDVGIAKLTAEKCPNLTNLDISNNNKLTNVSIKLISSNLLSLEALNIMDVSGLNVDNKLINSAYIYECFSKMNHLNTLKLNDWRTILQMASHKKNEALLRSIVETTSFQRIVTAIANSLDYMFALQMVFDSGYLDICKFILSIKGLSINAPLAMMLNLSLNIKNTTHNLLVLIEYLIQCGGVDLHFFYKNGDTPLIHAIMAGLGQAVCSILLKAGADCNLPNNKTGDSPLIVAVKFNKADCVMVLLKQHGINIHARNRVKRTVMDFAFQEPYYSVVDLVLTKYNILWPHNVKYTANTSRTIALFNKHASGLNIERVKDMIASGEIKDVNSTDENGLSAVMCATKGLLLLQDTFSMASSSVTKFIKLIHYLIEMSCNLNLQDKEGQSVLHHCVNSEKDDTTLLSLFLKAGADVTIKDSKGRDAFMIAKEKEKKIKQQHVLWQFCVDNNIETTSTSVLRRRSDAVDYDFISNSWL